MFRRFAINKINRQTNCYQGILVTLGTMKHKGQLEDRVKTEVESIFEALDKELPTPPDMETEAFQRSISWLKQNSPRFEACEAQMKRAAQILKDMGHEILVLEAAQLEKLLYEDLHQALVEAGGNPFQVAPL